ncbi:MAG: hypothetical protein HC801_02975 [Nitrospira sp.]|nr:hypothetical protein [Nitrospira sp.]
MMLFIESERGNVQSVKDTIVSCPDPSLLASHFYLELPQVFVKAGDRSGAIEIAKAMGNAGVLPLIGIAAHLAQDGDAAGVREALSHLDDENLRSMILNKVSAYQRRPSDSPHGTGGRIRLHRPARWLPDHVRLRPRALQLTNDINSLSVNCALSGCSTCSPAVVYTSFTLTSTTTSSF